ncbi:MAG: FAD/NAD(P)-binding protein [Rhizobiaceae bacterium]|nr:FAD/NAD(P)-binding protein [Rhizobiaceae bacterium]
MNAPNSDQYFVHAIIGDGLTAAAFLEYAVADHVDEFVIIGPNASQLGRGLAYAKAPEGASWEYAYLLNSPASDIDPEFKPWLEENWAEIERKMTGRKPDWLAAAKELIAKGDVSALNIPRQFFGDFLVERLNNVIDRYRGQGKKVRIVEELAVSIEKDDESYKIKTESGDAIVAHSIDVAPGGPKDQRMEGDESKFSAPTLFGSEERIIEHIKRGAEISCIGMNATMLDALRLCQSALPDKDLRFTAISPRGELPEPLIPDRPDLFVPELRGDHSTAISFLDDVKASIEQAKKDGFEQREIRAGYRAFFLEHGLANFVRDPEEAKFVPRTLRHWLRGGTRDTILDFHGLMVDGVTHVEKGAVREIQPGNDGATIISVDQMGNIQRKETGFVINCSGAGSSFEFDPLTNALIEDRVIDICQTSGGIAVGEGCATKLENIRFLSPATTIIGAEIMPMPLYDAHLLRSWVKRANGLKT